MGVGASMAALLPHQPNRSLIDGLGVLQALTASREPVGSRGLARQLGLEPTRTNRLLKTLAHLGLAQQDAERRYAVGPAIHVLAAQSIRASGLVGRAIEPLRALERFRFITAMGVLWRTEVCYIYYATPGATVAQSLGSRDPHPATTSGLGLALLAQCDDEEIRRRYADQPIAGYPDPHALLARIAEVRRDGYALTTTERSPTGTIAIAMGRPAYVALGLAGEIEPDQGDAYVAALRDAARRIEGETAATA